MLDSCHKDYTHFLKNCLQHWKIQNDKALYEGICLNWIHLNFRIRYEKNVQESWKHQNVMFRAGYSDCPSFGAGNSQIGCLWLTKSWLQHARLEALHRNHGIYWPQQAARCPERTCPKRAALIWWSHHHGRRRRAGRRRFERKSEIWFL